MLRIANFKPYLNLIFILTFLSCNDDIKNSEQLNENVVSNKIPKNEVVLISIETPTDNKHLIKVDSVGKIPKDSIGPKMLYDNSFSYLNHMNRVKKWYPKPGTNDTLKIEWYSENFEISTTNPFTSIKETFLVKKGDTVIFRYDNKIPKAKISNREVNEIELNYNNYRLEKLFDNKYSSHHLIFITLPFEGFGNHEDRILDYYNKGLQDFEREKELLDSLFNAGIISKLNYNYRTDAMNVLKQKNKRPRNIEKWLKLNDALGSQEELTRELELDLLQTDSLMRFSFFRDHLKYISDYDLNVIEENNGNSGGFYIDSRIQFDSINNDNRFNQTAKNFLLTETFKEIMRNFRIKDKTEYFYKLQANTTDRELLNQLEQDYNLNFEKANELILTSIENDTTTFAEILQFNKGKFLFIDIWASWCAPCRKLMPESNKLKKQFENKNVEFIYLSLNDNKTKWRKAIETDGISKSQNYFIENGMTSKIIENLGVKTIPHYLIYNPEGELINGYANRPGEGAKEQLNDFLKNK